MTAAEQPPAIPGRALRSPSEPSPVRLVIGGSITRADVPVLCERLRVLLADSDADHVVCDVGGLTDPDAVTVEALARLQLTARRLGRRAVLHHPAGELQQLLALMGLGDCFPLCAGLRLEASGEAEEREEVRRVEKKADSDDPTG